MYDRVMLLLCPHSYMKKRPLTESIGVTMKTLWLNGDYYRYIGNIRVARMDSCIWSDLSSNSQIYPIPLLYYLYNSILGVQGYIIFLCGVSYVTRERTLVS